jgi:hypothetical protein
LTVGSGTPDASASSEMRTVPSALDGRSW